VLSTVHTNDAPGAVTRLVDLGLEPFMVASSLVGVVSMRLVRTLCPKCREPYEAGASNLNRLTTGHPAEGTITLYRGRGCNACHETGYMGRTGIFEVLELDETLRTLIVQGAPDSTIRHAAVEAGMRSIGEDGLRKVMDGLTTLEEVTRVVYLAEQSARVCEHCQTVLSQDFDYCTACGHFVGDHCESCKRRMNTSWLFCPHCGAGNSRIHGGSRDGDESPVAERRSHRRRPFGGDPEDQRRAS
jgi:hypothetical protein